MSRGAPLSEEAAAARGVEPRDLIKTMLVRRGEGDYLLALVPGDRTISWPKLRTLLGVSRLSMPDAATAFEVTGFERGTITPFGTKTPLPVFADERIQGRTISIGAGDHGVAATLDGISQIPVKRGTNDLAAVGAAVDALRRGEAVGIFPEGTLSRGEHLRARRGAARLALACPEARVVLAAVEGGPDVLRFPRRPRMTVEFFEPAGGQARPDESADQLAQRLLDEIRLRVPPTK